MFLGGFILGCLVCGYFVVFPPKTKDKFTGI